jgi:hypothetical protein
MIPDRCAVSWNFDLDAILTESALRCEATLGNMERRPCPFVGQRQNLEVA